MVVRTTFLHASCCLATGFLFVALSSYADVKQGSAVVKAIKGTASSIDAFGFRHPLKVGAALNVGETVKTEADSTLDLLLDQNGAAIGLNANSQLRLDKLAHQTSALGSITDTRLHLQQGQLYGTVKKLTAGSHFEVKTPQGIAVVRGTEFFINAQEGTVYVTTGVVQVHLLVNLDTGGTITKDVSVNAGQYLTIPKAGSMQLWNALSPTPFSPKITRDSLLRLVSLGQLLYYTSGNASSSVAETFDGRTAGNSFHIDKPPTSTAVSP